MNIGLPLKSRGGLIRRRIAAQGFELTNLLSIAKSSCA
jgi:hypothetical protein